MTRARASSAATPADTEVAITPKSTAAQGDAGGGGGPDPGAERGLMLEDLFATHAARLRRLGDLLLLDREESQEVVQEVFLKAHNVQGTPNEPAEWGGWLTRVTVNACRDRRRAGWWIRFRRRGESVDPLTLPTTDPTPEEMAVGAETIRRIWGQFAQLPRRQREVFVLRYVAGCSTDEVATMLSVGTGSVKRHLFRAIRRLRALIGDVR